MSVRVRFYANEQHPDGSCDFCGRQVAASPGQAQVLSPSETATREGSFTLDDFDGEVCYDYEIEAAPEGGDVVSESRGGSCADVDWEQIPTF